MKSRVQCIIAFFRTHRRWSILVCALLLLIVGTAISVGCLVSGKQQEPQPVSGETSETDVTSSSAEDVEESTTDSSASGTQMPSGTQASSQATSAQGTAGTQQPTIAALLNAAPLNPTKTGCAKLDAQVAAIIGSGSTYERVKRAYDYLINNASYGTNWDFDYDLNYVTLFTQAPLMVSWHWTPMKFSAPRWVCATSMPAHLP